MGVYKSILRFIDLTSINLLIKSFLTIFIITLLIVSLFRYTETIREIPQIDFWLFVFLLSIVCVTGVRLFANYLLSDSNSATKVAIYGAGSAGIQLASALRVSKEMQPIAFIDNNASLHGTYLGGVKVLHPKKLERLSLRGKVDEVLIAIPSASKSILKPLERNRKLFS